MPASGNSSTGTSGPEQGPSQTYSDVAAVPGDWNIAVGNNKRQRPRQQQRQRQAEGQTATDNRVSPNSSADQSITTQPDNASLSGLKTEESTEMHVENIVRRPGDQLEDIAEKVRRYCRSKGIRIMQARVITNRRCDDVIGCRITIPVRQIDNVLGNRMWPDDVICRRWRPQQGLRAGRRHYNGQRERQYREGDDRNRYYDDYNDNYGYRDGDYRHEDEDRGGQRNYNQRLEQDYGESRQRYQYGER